MPMPEGFGPPSDDLRILGEWLKREPGGVFVAEAGGRVVGSVVAYHWGTLGLVGPLSVEPSWWSRGVGRRLVKHCQDTFQHWGCTLEKLYTYAESARHRDFFEKCGFHTRFLSELLSRPVDAALAPPPRAWLLSTLLAGRRALVIAEIRELTEQIYPGLVLDDEIHGRNPPHADLLLLREEHRIEAFAACDIVDAASVRTCHVKFAVVRRGLATGAYLRDLLCMVERFAAAHGCRRLTLGINAERWNNRPEVLEDGWDTQARTFCMMQCDMEKASPMDNYILSSWL
jgi:GNAT superfamily N-acetyltransferase